MSEPFVLEALDGRPLAATLYRPAGPTRGTVVMLGAYAVRQRYYGRFANYLAENGLLTLTFDNRGIGDSLRGHPRDEPATTTDWARLDHAAACRWLGTQPGPRLAVGHSFGGQIVGLTEEARHVEGLYGVACQLGYWGHYDGLTRWRMRLTFAVLMPLLTRLFGYLPGKAGLGEDVPPQAMLEWARWLNSPRYLIDHHADAADRFRAWPGRYVSLGFTDDGYAPPRGVEALAACFPPERTRSVIHKPSDVGLTAVDHFGFFRPNAKEALWHPALQQLLAWSEPG